MGQAHLTSPLLGPTRRDDGQVVTRTSRLDEVNEQAGQRDGLLAHGFHSSKPYGHAEHFNAALERREREDRRRSADETRDTRGGPILG